MRIRSTFQRVDSLSRFSLSCPALSSNPSFVLVILVISLMTNWAVPAVALPSMRASQQLHGNDSQVIHPFNRQAFCQPDQRPPQRCVYYLTAQRGYFHSMNFPKPFPVPILCSWIINATAYSPSPVIIVYLNQMYLKRGVRAVTFDVYGKEHVIGRTDWGEITYGARNVGAFSVMANYLEVQLSLDSLENANIRARNFLLDVYGFNITYEIVPNPEKLRLRPKNNSCHVDACSYNGNCYTNYNYSDFYCHCQDGYFGAKCQYGSECNPERNISRCKNSGVCEYSTGTFARCKCGLGYTGVTCEDRREIIENATECFLLTNLSCSHLCKVSDDNKPSCGCPSGYGLASDERSCYRLGSRRLIIQLQLRTFIEKEKDAKVLEQTLREIVLNVSASMLTVGGIDLSLDGLLTITMWRTDVVFKSSATTTTVPSSEMTRKSIDDTRNRIDVAKRLYSSYTSRLKRSDVIRANFKGTTAEITTTVWPSSEVKIWADAVSSTTSEFAKLAQRVGAFGRRRFELEFNVFKYWEEEGLILDWVKVDRSERLIKEGERFTIVCKARGSDNVRNVTFSWYKDGAFVDPEEALRGMEIVSLPPDLNGWHRSHLEIQKASVYDKGEFVCAIGQAEEKSIQIDILSAPQIKLTFLTSTVSKGSPFMMSCFDTNPLIQARRKYPSVYAWYRNGEPVMNSCQESFEDVYPVGSLLRVAEVNESTNYSCRVKNEVQEEEKVLQVNVAPPPSLRYRYCPLEVAANVSWRSTAPNLYDEQPCPWGYQGRALRFCQEQKCSPRPVESEGCVMGVWGQPDLGDCASEIVIDLREKADKLALGFMVTNWSELVEVMQLHVNELVASQMVEHNAEGRNMVRILEKVTWYLRAKEPNANLTDAALRTADALFRGGFIMETQTLTKLMGVVGSLASVLSMNQAYESFDIEILEAEINAKHIAASIDRSREQVQLQTPANSTPPQQAYLIRYSSTYPLLASLQLQPELAQVEAVSHPLTAYVPDVNWQLSFDLAKGAKESFALPFNATIPMARAFQHLAQSKERTRWRLDLVPVCAILSNNPWHTELCQTDDVAPYSVHVACQCKSAGTLVVLWLSGISKHESVAVSLGALGGMILSLPSIWLWATMWYRQRLSLTWLKLQFSCSVFAALCTLANATFRTPSFNVFPVVLYILLAGFTLCITTLIGMVALSFFSMEDTRSATSRIASLSLVACLLIMAIRMIMDHSQETSGTSFWWLADTLQITFFFVTNGLLACIMLVLLFSVKRKFRSLPEHSSHSARKNMAHTSLGLLFCIVAVEITSVFYVTKPNALSKSLLALACVILGLSTLMTYLRHDSCLDWSVIRWRDKQIFKLGRTPNSNSHANSTCQMGEASERLLKGSQKWNRPRKASLPLLKRAGLGPEVQMAFEEEIIAGNEVIMKRSRNRSEPKINEEESHVMLEEKFGTVREACELRDLCELASVPADQDGNEENQPRGRGDSGLGASTSDDSHENQRERKRSLKSSLSGWGLKVVAVITDFRSRQNTLSSENTVGTVTEEGDSVQTTATELGSRKESMDSGQPAPRTTVLLPATSCLLPKNPQPKAYSGSRKVTPTESHDPRTRLTSNDCPSRKTLRSLSRPITEGWTDVVTVEEFKRTRSHWEELIDAEVEGSELVKPHRGKFLLRISPEKKAVLNGRVEAKSTVTRRHRRYTKLAPPSAVPIKNCERCWINPESPACDLCYQRHTISTYAQVEPLPRDDSEYIPMNCTGNGSQEYLKMNGKVASTVLSTTEWCKSDMHGVELSSYRSSPSAPHSPALSPVLTHAADTSPLHPCLESPEMCLGPKRKSLPRFCSLSTFVKPVAPSLAGSQQWTPMKFCRSLDRRQRPRRIFKPCLRRKPWLLQHSIFACQIHSGSPSHRDRHNVIHKSDFDCNVDFKVRPFRYSLATL